ncbi:MAG: ABC transporter ATP-binding protein [Anaerolineae bacterium]
MLDKVDLDVREGQIYAIIGPNGCGKTTLLRAMSRSIRPLRGRVLMMGQDIFRMNTKAVARMLAVLHQNNVTISDATVHNLVLYGRFAHKPWWQSTNREDLRIADWAIERMNLSALRHRMLSTLSGGERQRAWIAMCLAQKPRILLLDEPTTFLDISHQLEIMELVTALNRTEGIAIVMVLHDINHAARFSDEMIVLKDGRVYCQGNPWEVLRGDVLEKVFHVEAALLKDEMTGKPVFLPRKVISTTTEGQQ